MSRKGKGWRTLHIGPPNETEIWEWRVGRGSVVAHCLYGVLSGETRVIAICDLLHMSPYEAERAQWKGNLHIGPRHVADWLAHSLTYGFDNYKYSRDAALISGQERERSVTHFMDGNLCVLCNEYH